MEQSQPKQGWGCLMLPGKARVLQRKIFLKKQEKILI